MAKETDTGSHVRLCIDAHLRDTAAPSGAGGARAHLTGDESVSPGLRNFARDGLESDVLH